MDFTDQKSVRDSLQDEEHMFRDIADSLPVQIWRASPNGHSHYFNKVWTDYTGLPARPITSEEWKFLEHPDDLATIQARWSAAIHGIAPFSMEFRFREAKSGLFKWVWSQAVPIKDEQGKVLRWLGANLEIDEEKREADRIKALVQRLLQLNRVKDDFIFSLSQEMRPPLLAILDLCEALQKDALSPDREALEAIRRSTASLLDIIDDLFDISHILRGTLSIQRERIDLTELVRTTLMSLTPSIQKAAIVLHAELSTLPLFIDADPQRVRQIVRHLVGNAIKFTPKGGKIHVRVAPEGAFVLLSVMDTGKGVAPEFMPHFFDLFAQEESYRTRQHGGLGLGLPIVKRLVELHGGSIAIISDSLNKGTKVEVRLPSQPC